MPSNFLSADTSLPELNDKQSTKEQVQEISNYLYMLLEQLRYTLNNLGEDNFNDTEFDDIVTTITTPVYMRLEDTEGAVSTLTATVDGMSLEVSNGSISSTIRLLANGITMSSQVITFTGAVTFSDLAGAGTTTINGANIKTGTISAVDIEGCTFRTILGSSGTVSGQLDFFYLSTAYLAGGLRLDDQGAGTGTDGRYRLFLYTNTVGGVAFNLKLDAAGGLSLEAGTTVYIGAGSYITLGAGTDINLNGNVKINGTPISTYVQGFIPAG